MRHSLELNSALSKRLWAFCKFGWIALSAITCVAEKSPYADGLLPDALLKTKEVYTARPVGVGWAEFEVNQEDYPKLKRNGVSGVLYTPVKKVALPKPLATLVEGAHGKKTNIMAAPQGYFIAYGKDRSCWLLTIEGVHDNLVTTTLLRDAFDKDDPKFSKLYWKELEHPQFKCSSRALTELLHKVALSNK